jgi:Periplasmic copper-binding protein (NosD)
VSVYVGGGRHRGATVAALCALACVLLLPGLARAEVFTVDSTANATDGALGDELCETEAGECTLRAAIEEGNSLGESSRVDFDEAVFAGQAADTIVLDSSLPTITVPTFINGRVNGQSCATEAGISGPCVGIDGVSEAPALRVTGKKLEVVGLAITGAQTAVVMEGSLVGKVQGSWLGVALDGAVVGNGTGALVAAGSNRSLIGGEGPGQGNVFAGNADNGLDVHGGNEVRVFGNYFGVEPDGITPAANGGDAIEVVSTGGSGVTGTALGTRVTFKSSETSPECDGGCNVISGSASSGIDLQGDGAPEVPAVDTTVAGNYIGLSASGTMAVPNAGAGVRVGKAPSTAIGGPSVGEVNRFAGGSAAVLAGPAAPDLSVSGNLIGLDAAGESTVDPPTDGIVVDSAVLLNPGVEARIVGNVIAMEEGVAIAQRGEGAWILGNEIFGSDVGIRTFESSVAHGNVIESNLIEGSATNGILLETSFNEIIGNEILGAGAAGIRILGAPPFGVSSNLIGGDAVADENFIAGSGGAAIEISNLEKTNNEVARNGGVGNGGLFIDLVAISPGTEVDPNRGIEPPTFSTVTQAAVSGGAKPSATVRVFSKQTESSGEIDSFLGAAVADGAGGWELPYDSAVPAGTIVAATQTEEGATSELAIAMTPGSNDGASAGGGELFGAGASGLPEGVIARIRPQTKIMSVKTRKRTARFVFGSDQAGSRFLCKLDDKPFDLCKAPKRYARLKTGRHVFWVRAVDPLGRVDLSPARKKFLVPG